MAEQGRFHQVFGQGGAVDHHKALICAGAVFVDDAGCEFLAGSGFTIDQHAGLAACGPGDNALDLVQLGAAAHQFGKIQGYHRGGLFFLTVFEGPLGAEHGLFDR